MRLLLRNTDLSAAMARTARAIEPIPAERTAAAPEPFVRVWGTVSLFRALIFPAPDSTESHGLPRQARICCSSRRRNQRHPLQGTKPKQNRARMYEVGDDF